MTTLILAEHNNTEMNVATLNAVTAAQAIGGDITVPVSYTHLTLPTKA